MSLKQYELKTSMTALLKNHPQPDDHTIKTTYQGENLPQCQDTKKSSVYVADTCRVLGMQSFVPGGKKN